MFKTINENKYCRQQLTTTTEFQAPAFGQLNYNATKINMFVISRPPPFLPFEVTQHTNKKHNQL